MNRSFILSSEVATAAVVGVAFAGNPVPWNNRVSPLADEHEHKAGEKHHEHEKHKEGEAHKEGEKHEHKDGDHKDEHKGEQRDLGKKEISGYTVQVVQSRDVKAGEEAVFVVTLSGGSGKPKAIRGWVGVESGEGSIKSKAEDEDKEYHLHHEVSKPMAAKSKLWIEIETGSGKKRASYDYKKDAAATSQATSR